MKARVTFGDWHVLGGTLEGSTKEVEITGYQSFADFLQRGVGDKWVNTGTALYAAYKVTAIELVEG